MEARALLQKIRQRGFTIKAIGDVISLAPKKLLNDRMITFVRVHKDALLTALYQEHDEQLTLHREHKRALHQGRLEVLRILLWRYIKSIQSINSIVRPNEIEAYLDDVLRQNNYDLEKVINHYSSITPMPVIPSLTCISCGYRPLFCVCSV